MAAPARSPLRRPAPAESLRIAYDARMSLGDYRGMGRYLRALIAGREDQLTGLCATGEADPDLYLAASGMHFHPLWEQVSIPRLLREYDIDVLLAPYNTAPLRLPATTRLVLVVHDLIFMDPMPFSRSLYQNVGRWYRQVVAPRAIQRADLIVTVSRYTARQLVSGFGVDERRLRIIPVSSGPEWFTVAQQPREHAKTVLAVAGEAPSKNLRRALEAFAMCRRQMSDTALRMRVAGVKKPYHRSFQQAARSLGIGDAVEFLPYVNDAEMREIYRAADVLLMPSLAEGFGIPVLEAIAAGLPVASSSATSLPEVGGDAALYFDPRSTSEMAGVLQRILTDSALRRQMSNRGHIQAARFHRDAIRPEIDAFWNELELQMGPQRPTELVSC